LSTSAPLFAIETFVEPATQLVLQSTVEHHTSSVAAHVAVDPNHWISLLSTTLQVGDMTISPNTLQPAHGHVASWFGSNDPHLAAVKSIAPSAKALESLGVTQTAPGTLPETLQKILSNGGRLLDARTIQAENFLPGFTPTFGILPAHQGPAETPATFAASVEWSARFLKVVDKIPEAAFAYALVEFFLLRPNLDLYKEEIREEPGAVAVETAVTVGVRLIAFGVVSALTLGIFG
jgi:hypothetical protein